MSGARDQVGPETRLLWDVIGNLRKLGWAVWSMEQHRRTRQTPGVSDLIVQRRELMAFLELKAGSNTPSEAQWDFLESMRGAGCHALVVWSWGELAWGLARVVPTVEGWIPEEAVPDDAELSGRFKEAVVRLYPRMKGILPVG